MLYFSADTLFTPADLDLTHLRTLLEALPDVHPWPRRSLAQECHGRSHEAPQALKTYPALQCLWLLHHYLGNFQLVLMAN